MATSNVPAGMDHPTVVPSNFESVEGETETDECEDEDGMDGGSSGSDAADATVSGASPR